MLRQKPTRDQTGTLHPATQNTKADLAKPWDIYRPWHHKLKFIYLENCCQPTLPIYISAVYHRKHLMPTVRHGGGGLMVWGYSLLPLSRPKNPLNTRAWWSQKAIYLSAEPWPKQNISQQNPEYSSIATTEWIRKERIEVFQQSNQCSDLIELQWRDIGTPKGRPAFRFINLIFQDLQDDHQKITTCWITWTV